MNRFINYLSSGLTNKFVLAAIGAGLIVVSFIGVYTVWFGYQLLQDQLLRQHMVELDTTAQTIRGNLTQLENDVLFLSTSPILGEYLAAVYAGQSGEVAQNELKHATDEFLAFAQNRKIYDQVRFIDAKGDELIRVNTAPTGVSMIVPPNELQNKADRYYFTETMDTAPGKIFVSQLDLNVENGEIEVLPDGSVKPVIRYGTPVVFNGRTVGVIVTNVLAENFLGGLVTPDSHLFMVDQDGYYLQHPDQTKRWGRDLGTGITIFGDYSPETAVRLLAYQAGTIVAEGIIFAHRPLTVPNFPKVTWFLVDAQPRAVLFEPIRNFLSGYLFVATVVILVVVMIAATIGQNISRQINRLINVALRVAKGDFSEQIEPQSRDEIGKLTVAFNEMANQLTDVLHNLEDRVRDRTAALEASVAISRQVTTILDVDRLLREVVDRIQKSFNYYHVHIYVVDQQTGDLVMREGTGIVGQQLKSIGHRLKLGQGIVGQVAATGQSFLAGDVYAVEGHYQNPLLPDTKSELAVPLMKSNEVLGVLDIQSDARGRFLREDLMLMESIAGLVATALDNARQFREMRRIAAEADRLSRQLTRQSWQGLEGTVPSTGYVYKGKAVFPGSTEWITSMEEAVVQKHLVEVGNGSQENTSVAIPLTLRDEVIGVIGIERPADRQWSEDELLTIRAVADQVGPALENARLSMEQEKTIEQLKEVDRLKSEFLTSMSHELRTPLNSIIGFADVLLQGIDGDLPDVALDDIQLIHNSGQHLLALINDVLDLSKIEAERMELVLEDVNLREVVQHVLSASSTLVKKKPVAIEIDVDETLPLVRADRLRLNQILLNLISNSAKFTEKGTITIRAGLDPVTPELMRVTVADTGIGIAADKLEAVFDRFRQADSSTTRRYGGTGLGLAICRKLVELHGGTINVSSTVGQGSEFSFTIPVATVIEATTA